MMNEILDDNGLQYLLSLMKDELYDKQKIEELLDKAASIDIVIQGNAQVNNTDIRYRQPYSGTISPLSGYAIVDVEVLMGEDDITSTSYNNGSITISKVTDIVIVNVQTTEFIVFEDDEVKRICVENWGGGYASGEITKLEASLVTNLGIDKNGDAIAEGAGPFYNNQDISYFDEFKYFTGITGAGLYWKNTGNTVLTYRGKFANCSLKKLTIPAIPTTCLAGIFYYCRQLEEIDLSNVTVTGTSEANRRISVAFPGCSAVKKVIFPPTSYIVPNVNTMFGATSSGACSNLEYIDFKNIDFRSQPTTGTTPYPMLRYCPKLAHLPSGMHNLMHTQTFTYNPLTHDSAVALLNSLGTVTTEQTITFNATTYDTLTPEEIAIGTNKGWSIVSA